MSGLKQNILFGLPIFLLLLSACSGEKTFTVETIDAVRNVHNLGPLHDAPQARLEFNLQLGSLDAEDENLLFEFPIGTAVDDQNNYYILDMKECCIRKFDAEGKFLSRFGRSGQGPGEMENPQIMDIDGQGRLVVECGNHDFHIFKTSGEYIGRIPPLRNEALFIRVLSTGEIVGYSMEIGGENSPDNQVLALFDLEGRTIREFGKPLLVDSVRGSWSANFLKLAVNSQDDILASFNHQNRIDKYNRKGELLMTIDRPLPYPLQYGYRKQSMVIRGEKREITREDFTKVSRGIGVDDRDRIWVQVFTRQMPEDMRQEDFVLQEFYEFEVYREDGVLLFKAPLPESLERFDNWSLHGNHICFVDPYGEGCVFVYDIVEM